MHMVSDSSITSQHGISVGCVQSSQSAAAGAQLLSGCAWEPLSAAELAGGMGKMHIAALISAGHCNNSASLACSGSSSSSSGIACLSTPVVGEVLQRLSLTGPAEDGGSSSAHMRGHPDPAQGQQPAAAGAAEGCGVLWDIDGCPAASFEAMHACASQALKRELAATLTTAGGMPVSGWRNTQTVKCSRGCNRGGR
jgi:hypothetical protein